MNSGRKLNIVLYSDDSTTRGAVISALGKKVSADMPEHQIREFATATAPILIANPEKILAALNLDILLAHSFGPDHLTTI